MAEYLPTSPNLWEYLFEGASVAAPLCSCRLINAYVLKTWALSPKAWRSNGGGLADGSPSLPPSLSISNPLYLSLSLSLSLPLSLSPSLSLSLSHTLSLSATALADGRRLATDQAVQLLSLSLSLSRCLSLFLSPCLPPLLLSSSLYLSVDLSLSGP